MVHCPEVVIATVSACNGRVLPPIRTGCVRPLAGNLGSLAGAPSLVRRCQPRPLLDLTRNGLKHLQSPRY